VRIDYIIRRIFFFFVIIWLAATVNFFLPRVSGKDPLREKLMYQAAVGGGLQSGINSVSISPFTFNT
jgi:peptide/nickel transport system permease protein